MYISVNHYNRNTKFNRKFTVSVPDFTANAQGGNNYCSLLSQKLIYLEGPHYLGGGGAKGPC